MAVDTDHKNNPKLSNILSNAEQADNRPNFLDDPTSDFPIVGIGASAGGLAAFEKFFTALPPDSGMAFVVVQHLSLQHKSILPEILQRYTSMPVVQITTDVEVKPNGVYVVPPGSDLALSDGHLILHKLKTERGLRLPIDIFFRSLAKDQGAGAIGIVLSGTGSDGSLGLKTIKAEGGLTIAQEPDTAEFGDMPRNAIATKDVDYILPPEKIGGLILKYIHHQVLNGYKRGENEFQIPVGGLQKLYYILRSRTGHDFSLYKQNTLLRRIERRMKICLVKQLDEYLDHLQEHPEEIAALFQEMLINVTHFFRDPEAYQALAAKVIHPLIILKHTTQDPFRVWVAGCSSGEEAYSLAILIQEQLQDLKIDCKVQIYATDLDGEAILAARKGFYSDGSLENVSAERLQRFFRQEDQGYQIKKLIRDMVVFSTQNMISDPPFSKIDLVSCRNVLIYLEHELQNQLFLQFHFSLNPGGVLFLGNSESLGSSSALFAVIDRKHRIFQRKEVTTQRKLKTHANLTTQMTISDESRTQLTRSITGGLRDWTDKLLLEYHTPACVIIDQKHNILFIHGRTGKYLEPVAGEANSNIIRMAREGLKTELATAIRSVITHKETFRQERVQVRTNGDYQPITLTVRLVVGPADYGELIMVVFEDTKRSPSEETALKDIPEKSKSRQVVQLEKELREKDEYLHTIINELEDNNQDLKSINEELQSANEEMQSTNEELETSKEELQSINEELSTLNAELQNKNDELSRVNNDIYNLLTSIEIGTIFLDLDLRIRRFTPTVKRIYNLLPGDIGRPIRHFVSSLEYDHLIEDVQQVLHNLVRKAIEVQDKNGNWYLINIRPYRTLENVIDGTVITFVDINEQKRADVLRRLGTILHDSNDAITVQDFTGKILAWNRGATQLYGWKEAEALTMNALELIPEIKRSETLALYNGLAHGESVRSFETQRVTRDGKILDIWMTLTVLVDDAKKPIAIASTERYITDREPDGQVLVYENRALKALNHWYQTRFDTTVQSSQSLLEAACRILVAEAGYRLAWIGRIGKDKAENITPIAWVGVEHGEPDLLAETDRERLEKALISGQPVAVRNLSINQHAGALEHHFRSFLVLPIIHEKNPLGILVIYASEPDAFVEQEISQLVLFSRHVAQAMIPHRNMPEGKDK